MPEQHLQPLGAAFQVRPVHLGVAARAGSLPGGLFLPGVRTLPRRRLPRRRAVVRCSALLHLASEPPRNRVPLYKAFRVGASPNVWRVACTLVLALLYDIHGNLPALEAVLADA